MSFFSVPPDLCLLGCIFFICDYPEDSEDSEFCDDWRKVIRQFGGEVEDTYHPRITHLLCKTQDSAVSLQAIREGKRLVTVYWLNDIVVKKKVMPPWKAIHFPLPAK
jgi:PAX-interacting protein 1